MRISLLQNRSNAAAVLKLVASPSIRSLPILPIWLLLQPAYADMIPRQAEWKYSDHVFGYQTGLQNSVLSDSSWMSDFEHLRYGDGDETITASYEPDDVNTHITTLVRHRPNKVLLVGGEVHLASDAISELDSDAQLMGSPVVRGPYLQRAFETGITIRWRTATDHDAILHYGKDLTDLSQIASDPTQSTEHSIVLSGLEPDTRYYYSIGDSAGLYPSQDNQYFDTHPMSGSAATTRIWVLGDSGTADEKAASVRSAYTQFNDGTHSDVWLMLGDNAYDFGTDDEYQAAVFDMYPEVLRNSVLWPTLGNHDGHTADSSGQSGNYYDIFSLPTNGESGGVASGTEAYYSFNYGNIHFISLDSTDTNRSANGAMATWLKDDLAANTQEWMIAFWHHPPYSKGSHDSDSSQRLTDMRENFLPILESHGVDLVLSGHSHSYERSMLIDGHYGKSDTFAIGHLLDSGDGDPSGSGAYNKLPGSNNGAVYSVAGSSGKKTSNPSLDHPVMISNLAELGSMVIDIQGNQLDAIFLDDNATVLDSFRIMHRAAPASLPSAPGGLSATVASANEVKLQWTDNASDEDNIIVQKSIDMESWIDVATLAVNASSFTDRGLSPDTYYYRVIARNASGESSPSNTIDVTIPGSASMAPPLAPSELSASVISTDAVELLWTDNASDEDNLIVQTSTDMETWDTIATLLVDASSFIDRELSPNTYYYRVIAKNSAGESSPTNTVNVTISSISMADALEIGSGMLDHDKVEGKRWTQVDFEPLINGTHTIQVTWSGDADIRFTLFRVRSGSTKERIDTIVNNSPAQWTGTLDSSQQYYLGVWSASGTARFSAVLKAEGVVADDPGPEEPVINNPLAVIIDEGTVDSSKNEGPRWVRLNFESLAAGEHTIEVAWDYSQADVRYKIKTQDGTTITPTIRGENPGIWKGELEADTSYFIGLWSSSGATDYTASIEVDDDS